MVTIPDDLTLRLARDSDAEGIIDLIGEAFAAYDGCVLDLDDLDQDLLAIRTAFDRVGGKFWVVTEAGRVIASVGYAPGEAGGIELKKLYVRDTHRRRGIASALLELVLDEARRIGAESVDLWSDTRFTEAHAFYLAHGFEKLSETRDLHDPSNTTEYHFIRRLAGGSDTPES